MLKKIGMTLGVILSIIFILVSYIAFDNCQVSVNKFSITSPKVTKDFNNYKIAVLSDFHSSTNYNQIIRKVTNESPDIILLLGDMINMNETTFSNTEKLVDGIVSIAPTYFVSGNNETWSKHESEFLKILTDKGVFVLNNKLAKIEKGDSYINLLGYKDILYADDVMRFNVLEKELSKLEKTIPADDKSLNILMFHRVNYFDTVSKYNFDLVLSGHAHGGQINLPIIKDKILDKNLGQHKYSNGYYENGDKKMIATAGLEKNLKKPRIFNTPEIVMVKLEMEK